MMLEVHYLLKEILGLSFLYFLLPQEIVADDELVFVGMLLLDTVQIDSCHHLAVVMKWLTIIFTFLLLSFSFWSLSFFFGVPALKRAYVFLAGVASILNTTHPCDHFQPICHCFLLPNPSRAYGMQAMPTQRPQEEMQTERILLCAFSNKELFEKCRKNAGKTM